MSSRFSGSKIMMVLLVALFAWALGAGCAQKNDAGSGSSVLAEESGAFLSKEQVVAGFAALSAGGSYASYGEYDAAEDNGEVPLSEIFGDEEAGSLEYGDGAAGSDIDLRPYDTPVKNQGKEGLCTAFATVSAMENLAKQRFNSEINLSERHLWRQYRKYNIYSSVKAARGAFVMTEAAWPYNSAKPVSNEEGIAMLTDSTSLPSRPSLKTVTDVLARGNPLVIGVPTTRPFFNKSGFVNAHGRASGMGHAMAVVGAMYDSRVGGGGYFVIKNSWGPTRGDKGYIYMPFEFCAKGMWNCRFIEMAAIDLRGATPSGPVTPSVTPATGALNVAARYGGKDGTNQLFALTLAGDAATLGRVRSVRYHVHPTFGTGEYTTVSDAADHFATRDFSTYSKTWSTRGATVTFDDGSTQDLPGVPIRW